ncbi:MAG: bL27 family ribosomal protein [Candidatus Omnitrophica bacterium]|jgi:large subunit ribosomal protein L27|nr:bL27 family ribosomal protein [Candidatus Omnitrophota bacterium]
MGRKKQCNGRDSRPKTLGVKVSQGNIVKPGNIIIRQKGSKIYPGKGTNAGSDWTIYAMQQGIVNFTQSKKRKIVEVLPLPINNISQ